MFATGSPAGGSTAWTRVGTNLPAVQIQDLYVNLGGLFALTHGRGAWKLPAPADLAAVVTGPASFPKGTHGADTVTVTNNGPATASSATLSDAVPAGTTFVSESQTAGPAFTCTNPAAGVVGTSTCTISSLASKATATFKLTYALPATTTHTTVVDTAKVSSTINPDPTTANNTSTATTPVS